MSEEFWSPMLATVIGGMIAAFAGALTMYYGKKLERKDKRRSLLTDAYAEWARCLEETLSPHDNFYRLLALHDKTSAGTEERAKCKEETMRVSTEAGNAGRRLDSAHYRILLLENRKQLRNEVSQITDASMMQELGGIGSGVSPSQYSTRAKQIRQDLKKFFRMLADSCALS